MGVGSRLPLIRPSWPSTSSAYQNVINYLFQLRLKIDMSFCFNTQSLNKICYQSELYSFDHNITSIIIILIMNQGKIVMDEEHLKYKYGILWIIICEHHQLDQYKEQLTELYLNLQIMLTEPIFQKIDGSFNFIERIGSQIGFIKYALFENGNVLRRTKEMNQFTLGIRSETCYYSVDQFSKIKQMAFKEMKVFLNSEIFTAIKKRNWLDEQFIMLLMKHTMIKDTDCSEGYAQRAFQKTFSPMQILSLTSDQSKREVLISLHGYQKLPIQERMGLFDFGYVVRAIFNDFKNHSLNKKVTCYKVLRCYSDLKLQSKNRFYFQNSFQPFYQLLPDQNIDEPWLIKEVNACLQNRINNIILIKIQAHHESGNKFINFGYKCESNGHRNVIIFNCFTLLQLIRIESKQYYKKGGKFYQNATGKYMSDIPAADKFKLAIYQFKAVSEEQLLKLEGYGELLQKHREEFDCLIHYFNYLNRYNCNIRVQNLQAQLSSLNYTQPTVSQIMKKKSGRIQSQLNPSAMKINQLNSIISTKASSILSGQFDISLISDCSMTIDQLQLCPPWGQLIDNIQDINLPKIAILLHRVRLFLSSSRHRKTTNEENKTIVQQLRGIYTRLKDFATKLCPQRGSAQHTQTIGKYNICRLLCCKPEETKLLSQSELTQKIEQKLRLQHYGKDTQVVGLQRVRKDRRDILILFQLLKSILLELHSECTYSIQMQDFYTACFSQGSQVNQLIRNLQLDILSLKQKEKNYNILLNNYQEQLQKYSFPISERSLNKNLRQQKSVLVNWQKLQKSCKGNKILLQKFQQLIILLKKSNYNPSKLLLTFRSYASCLRLEIGLLKVKGYCDDSIEIMQLYRKLASVYSDIICCSDSNIDQSNQLIMLSRQLDQIQFKQIKNGFIIKGFTHKKVAEMMLRLEKNQQCQQHTKISLKMFEQAQKKIVQTGHPFLFSRDISELQLMSVKLMLWQNDQQQLKASLGFIQNKEKKWGDTWLGYKIDAQILSIYIGERINEIEFLRKDGLNGRKSNIKHSQRYKDILNKEQYSPYLKGYRYALLCVDMFLCFYNYQFLPEGQREKRRLLLEQMQKQIKPHSYFLALMQDNLKLINKYSQEYDLYKWIQHLHLFLKERSQVKRCFQLFPGDEAIQNCLRQFENLKRRNKMTIQLKRLYLKVYAMYRHYICSHYVYYRPQSNIYNMSQEPKKQDDIEVEQEPYRSIKKCWLFLLEANDQSNLKQIAIINQIRRQQEKGYFGQKINNPISHSFQQFRENLRLLKKQQPIQVRINLFLELRFWRNSLLSNKNQFQNIDYKQLDHIYVYDVQDEAMGLAKLRKIRILSNKMNSELGEEQMEIEGADNRQILNKPEAVSNKNEIQVLDLDLMERPIGSKIVYIKAEQILNTLKQIYQVIRPNQIILKNTIFYTQKDRCKIATYHNKLQYFTSLRDDFERDLFYKCEQALKRQLAVNLQLTTLEAHQRLPLLIKIWNELESLYKKKQSENLVQRQLESLQSLIYATIKIYIDSKIKYHEWVNGTLRQDYRLYEKQIRNSNRIIIFPIYHSIRQISKLQVLKDANRKAYRWAYMSQQQCKDYKSYFSSINDPYVKMVNIFSTSLSEKYLLDNILGKKGNLVVFQIQMNLSEDDINHPLNHGFIFPISLKKFNKKIKEQHDIRLQSGNQYEQEQQVIFNIGNIFRILSVKEKVKCSTFINSRDSFKGIKLSDNQREDLQKYIIVIKLQFGNFKRILSSQNTNKQSYYFQAAFAEQRKKKQLKMTSISAPNSNLQENSKGIGVCFYDIVQYYLDEGYPDLAKKIIQERFEVERLSVAHFLDKSRGQNHIHRIIKIHQRLGQDQVSQEYVEDFLKKLADFARITKQKLTVSKTAENQLQAQKIKKVSLEFYMELIKLYRDKKDLTAFQDSIGKISKQISQLRALQINKKQLQNFNNNSYEIFLHMIKSQSYLYKYEVQKSMEQFDLGLKLMESTASAAYKSTTISTHEKQALYTDFKENIGQLKNIINDYQTRGVKSVDKISKFIQKMPNLLRTVHSLKGEQFNHQQINNLRNSQAINNLSYNFASSDQAASLLDLSARTNDSFQRARVDAKPDQIQQIMKANFDLYCKVSLQKKQPQNFWLTINAEMEGLKKKILTRIVNDLDQLGYKNKSIELSKKKIEYLKQNRRMKLSTQEQLQKHLKMIFESNTASAIKIEECRYNQYKAQNLLFRFLKKYQLSKPQQRQSKLRQYVPQIQECLRLAKNLLNQAFGVENSVRIEMSNQNLEILLLDLRMQCIKSSSEDKGIIDKTKRLSDLLDKKDEQFDVRNQYIMFYQICTRFKIKIKRAIHTGYYGQLKARLRQRYALKPQSIENAIDCIKLYEELTLNSASLYINNLEEDLNTFYMYIEETNQLCYNHRLYWKFVQCKYQRIKQRHFKTTKEFLIAKLDFLLRAIRIVKDQEDEDQLVLEKFKIMIEGFIDNRFIDVIQDQDLKKKLDEKKQLFALINHTKNHNNQKEIDNQNHHFQLEETEIYLQSEKFLRNVEVLRK